MADHRMPTSRLEAFSDGVLAIIITVMVLQLPVPGGERFGDLITTAGVGLLTYLLSFAYVGIYWNNHHHLFQAAERVSGGVLWANLHLLLWLSLLPFTTAWMDATGLARAPVVVYGVNLLGAAVAYLLLQRMIMRAEGSGSLVRRAVRGDSKGKAALGLYVVGIVAAAFIGDGLGWKIAAIACFVAVAAMWFVPDRRIERLIAEERSGPPA